MQSTSCKMLGWMKYKLESRLPGELNNPRNTDDTTLMAESEEELMRLLMRVKEGSEKVDLKLSFQKTKIMGGIWSHHFMANRRGKSGSSDRFNFPGFQNHSDNDYSHEIKRHWLLGRKL